MKKRILITFLFCCATLLMIIGANSIISNKESVKPNKQKPSSFTTMEEIKLPAPSHSGDMSVEEALQTRRSFRNFKQQSLSLEQVSQLLWATYGVSYVSSSGREYKTAPSAGATYPLEIYLLVGNVENLEPGLYRYLPGPHSLLPEKAGDLRKAVKDACLGQKMLEEAPASIVFSAVYERTTSRYGTRGDERYVCMDLGHAAQNTYLQATAMGLVTCAVGAFEDDKLQKVLQFPANEKVLYLMPVGYTE